MKSKAALFILLFLLSLTISSCRIKVEIEPMATVTKTPEPSLTPTSTPTPTPTQEPTPNLPVFVDPVIFNFEFFTPTQGWAVTRDRDRILFTTDGGQTWLDATPSELHPLPSEVDSLGIRAFFLDETTVWFTPYSTDSGTLYHTQDRGENWATPPVPFDNARYDFLNLNDGYALVSLGAGAGSHYVALYQTRDGGATWTQVFTHEPGESKSLREGGSKNGITFLDLDHGWVGGAIPMDNYFYLFVTEDGGVTWEQETDISLPAAFAGSMLDVWQPFFVNDTVGYLPVYALGLGATSHLLIYRSSDSGRTWTYQNAIEDGEALDFSSVDEGWLASSTALHHTTDGGGTWSPLSTSGIPAGEFFLKIDFVDSQHGWVLTTPDESSWDPLRLFQTTDGGGSWVQLLP